MFAFVRKSAPVRWACGSFLLICLLVSSEGCGSGKKKSIKHQEVTGKVTYQGKAVTGGRVVFFNEEGFNGEGVIDESGNYSISAPVGNVKIMVDNKMLQSGQREAATKGAGPRPGGEEPKPIKGKYVQLPQQYSQPDKTDLSYTVKDGAQTHDIDLK